MPGNEGDDAWDDWEDADTQKTQDKTREAPVLPEAPDDTGKHRTLQGYVDQEIEISRARLDERKFWRTAFVLFQMAHRVHVLAAQEVATKLERWAADPENTRLIRLAMKEDA